MEIGAQLYTVREYTKTLEDFAKTLQKVSEIGYRTVQVSGTVDFNANWLADQLQKNDLRCVLTHIKPEKMLQNPQQVIAEHDIFNCRYIGLGSVPGGLKSMDDYLGFKEKFLPVAKIFKESGKLLMFHNHADEFRKSDDGRVFMDRMMEDFAPDEMGFTLDTYWAQAAGADAAAWIRKLNGRVPCIHLKDMLYEDGIKMAPVYEGNMNFDGIIAAAQESETQFMLVEQDDSYGKNPFDELKRSYENLSSRGYR